MLTAVHAHQTHSCACPPDPQLCMPTRPTAVHAPQTHLLQWELGEPLSLICLEEEPLLLLTALWQAATLPHSVLAPVLSPLLPASHLATFERAACLTRVLLNKMAASSQAVHAGLLHRAG